MFKLVAVLKNSLGNIFPFEEMLESTTIEDALNETQELSAIFCFDVLELKIEKIEE